MTDDDDNVVDMTLRRTKQRKDRGEQTEQDEVLQVANEVARMYAEMATRIGTLALVTAIYLAEKALYTTLAQAIGLDRARDLLAEARKELEKYEIRWPAHSNSPTVFDRDKDDE